jgi:hypothetical protein
VVVGSAAVAFDVSPNSGVSVMPRIKQTAALEEPVCCP